LLFYFFEEAESVGAQWSACLIFSTQILAVEKKPASAPAQVLAES
jgi:hypothetical protein